MGGEWNGRSRRVGCTMGGLEVVGGVAEGLEIGTSADKEGEGPVRR